MENHGVTRKTQNKRGGGMYRTIAGYHGGGKLKGEGRGKKPKKLQKA